MYLYIKHTIEFMFGINKKIDFTLSKGSIDEYSLYVDRTVNFTLYRER